jgi:hypothetical protein
MGSKDPFKYVVVLLPSRIVVVLPDLSVISPKISGSYS